MRIRESAAEHMTLAESPKPNAVLGSGRRRPSRDGPFCLAALRIYDARLGCAIFVALGGTGMTVHHARVVALAAVLVGISSVGPSTRIHAQRPLYQLALEELRELAEQGDVGAQYHLANRYSVSFGGNRTPSTGRAGCSYSVSGAGDRSVSCTCRSWVRRCGAGAAIGSRMRASDTTTRQGGGSPGCCTGRSPEAHQGVRIW